MDKVSFAPKGFLQKKLNSEYRGHLWDTSKGKFWLERGINSSRYFWIISKYESVNGKIA